MGSDNTFHGVPYSGYASNTTILGKLQTVGATGKTIADAVKSLGGKEDGANIAEALTDISFGGGGVGFWPDMVPIRLRVVMDEEKYSPSIWTGAFGPGGTSYYVMPFLFNTAYPCEMYAGDLNPLDSDGAIVKSQLDEDSSGQAIPVPDMDALYDNLIIANGDPSFWCSWLSRYNPKYPLLYGAFVNTSEGIAYAAKFEIESVKGGTPLTEDQMQDEDFTPPADAVGLVVSRTSFSTSTNEQYLPYKWDLSKGEKMEFWTIRYMPTGGVTSLDLTLRVSPDLDGPTWDTGGTK